MTKRIEFRSYATAYPGYLEERKSSLKKNADEKKTEILKLVDGMGPKAWMKFVPVELDIIEDEEWGHSTIVCKLKATAPAFVMDRLQAQRNEG